jgi:MoaA/NifB/PqqE/SkfB family radical SAM enzyme
MDLGVNNLDIYLTGKCNYRCEYCYGEDESKGDMTIETFEKAVAFAEYIGAKTLQYCGGEPLMSSHFIDNVSIAREKGFKQILRTNAIYLPKYIDLVAENFDWIGISLDGCENANAKMRPSKNSITAKEQFEIPVNCIWDLKRKNPKIKILLATLASKINYMQIEELYLFIKETKLPIDKWKIYQFICEKFRSKQNKDMFGMENEDFDLLKKMIPENLNGIPVIFQSADTEGVAGNCLIIYQDGSIQILGKYYGNINTDEFEDIVTKLLDGNTLNIIGSNKKYTYGV